MLFCANQLVFSNLHYFSSGRFIFSGVLQCRSRWSLETRWSFQTSSSLWDPTLQVSACEQLLDWSTDITGQMKVKRPHNEEIETLGSAAMFAPLRNIVVLTLRMCLRRVSLSLRSLLLKLGQSGTCFSVEREESGCNWSNQRGLDMCFLQTQGKPIGEQNSCEYNFCC